MDLSLWAPPIAAGLAACVVALVVSARGARRDERRRPIAGTIAVVAIAIPEGGVGRITHAARGAFARLPARAAHGGAIATGTPVVVVDLARGVATVEPLPIEFEGAFR